jgi:hypothetical protein
LGLFRLTADKIAQIFGVGKHKRIRGRLHSMLEKLHHGHHVLRFYSKSLLARMYEKFATFLRLEVCVNRLKDLGLNKGLENLNALRQKLMAVTDRLAGFEADLLNVHVDFPLFQRLALPIPVGSSKIPGIKIHDTRMMRLMEVLLHAGSQTCRADGIQGAAACYGCFPTRSLTSSVFGSARGCAANYRPRWKSSTTVIMFSGPAAEMPSCACTRSSRPSFVWKH